MATNGVSRIRVAIILGFVAALLAPVVAPWVGLAGVPAVDTRTLVRLVGFGVLGLIILVVVLQKRRSRGQRASEDAPEEAGDRQVEENRQIEENRRADGSGKPSVSNPYKTQQETRREAERLTDSERLADSNRVTDSNRSIDSNRSTNSKRDRRW